MPRPVVVSIPHSLGKEEALRRLKSGMARATLNIPVLRLDEEHWAGDRLMFRVSALGQVASGSVDVGDDTVRLEVTLPWMLQKFAEVVQAAVRARGRILLAKK